MESRKTIFGMMTDDYRFKYYNEDTRKIDFMPLIERMKYRYFELLKGYEIDKDGIIKFMKDFEIWANQLSKGNFNNNLPKGQNCINIDIKKYFNYQD